MNSRDEQELNRTLMQFDKAGFSALLDLAVRKHDDELIIVLLQLDIMHRICRKKVNLKMEDTLPIKYKWVMLPSKKIIPVSEIQKAKDKLERDLLDSIAKVKESL